MGPCLRPLAPCNAMALGTPRGRAPSSPDARRAGEEGAASSKRPAGPALPHGTCPTDTPLHDGFYDRVLPLDPAGALRPDCRPPRDATIVGNAREKGLGEGPESRHLAGTKVGSSSLFRVGDVAINRTVEG